MDHETHLTIAALNALSPAAFGELLGGLFEHSPWIADRAAERRPVTSFEALHDAFMQVVHDLSPSEQISLIRAHPELAGAEATEQRLTDASASEQGRLGFTALMAAEHAELAALNAQYRARFGFPCIIALSRHTTRESVYAAFRARLAHNVDVERATALAEIAHITRARLARLLDTPIGTSTI